MLVKNFKSLLIFIALEAHTIDILAMVKELKRLVNGQVSGVEHMDGGEGVENSSDSEDN